METEYDLDIQEIVRMHSNKNGSYADTFIYEPANIEETPLGALFMAGEVESNERSKLNDDSDIINIIASAVRREYYANPQRGSAASFDACLKKANRAFVEHARRKYSSLALRLHIVIAACATPILHFSRVNNARLILYRGEEAIDLSKRFIPAPEQFLPSKIFSAIASGRLQRGDFLALGTPALFNAFSLEELRRILSEFPLRQARDKIETELESKTQSPFAGLLLHAQSGVGPEAIKIRSSYAFEEPPKSDSSISFKEITEHAARSEKNPIHREEAGDGVPARVDTKRIPHHIGEKISAYFAKPKEVNTEIIPPLTVRARERLRSLANPIRRLMNAVPFYKKWETSVHNALPNMTKPRAWLSSYPIRLAVLIIIILIIGIFAKSGGDTFDVGTSPSPAASPLPLEHIALSTQRIGDLQTIVNFSALDRAIQPEKMVAFDAYLIFWDEKAVYTISQDKEAGEFLFPALSDNERIIAATTDDSSAVLITSERFLRLNASANTYRPVPVNPALRANDIVDVSRYKNNIYILYKDGSITKYSPDAEFASYSGKAWMKESAHASDPRGMSNDGSIYVIEGERIITRFHTGKREEEKELPQEIPSIAAIFTDENLDIQYVSSPSANAIFEIKKEGWLIETAYIHEKFGMIKDFAISPDEKTITVIIGDTAYQFNTGK